MALLFLFVGESSGKKLASEVWCYMGRPVWFGRNSHIYRMGRSGEVSFAKSPNVVPFFDNFVPGKIT